MILTRFICAFSGSEGILSVKSVSPTIAFIGVRISWLIRDRKSLLARLPASALSNSSFILAEWSRERKISNATVKIRMRNNAATVIAIAGFA